MQRLELGGRGYNFGTGIATITQTPLADRANIITEISITNPSAADSWTLTVGGREVARFRIDTVGNNQALGVEQILTAPVAGSQLRPSNIFDIVEKEVGIPLQYPIPQGMSGVLASVGGATADLIVEFKEVDPADLSPQMINHPLGKEFIMPIYGTLAAAATVVGPTTFDTQFAPPWVPNLFTGTLFPVGFRVKALRYFFEGQGRNTFSGAANHQSVTSELIITKNGQQLYSRNAGHGMPLRGMASAAGSANSVFGQEAGMFPPIQSSGGQYGGALDPNLTYNGGDSVQFQYLFAGDLTGGADYSHALQCIIADVVEL